MIYILFSVLCSLVVTVLLRLAPDYRVDMRLAVTGNYLVAGVLCLVLLDPDPAALLTSGTTTAWLVLGTLGVLLPTLFLAMATSIRHVGIVRTDAAHRLSLVLALIAAFTVFGETPTVAKVVGGAIGLVAIACIVSRPGARHTQAPGAGKWIWPVTVFFGTGVIDILFKEMAVLSAIPFADVLFASFALALVLSVAYSAWLFATHRASWAWRHAGGAVLLGSFNFGNILFYIEAHRHLASNPALVFSVMNISVIVLATAIGVWSFSERLGRINQAGIVLAVSAVLVLTGA